MEAKGRGGEREEGRPVLRKGEETLQTDGWKGGVSRSCWGNTRLTLWSMEGKLCEGFLSQGHGWTLPWHVWAPQDRKDWRSLTQLWVLKGWTFT